MIKLYRFFLCIWIVISTVSSASGYQLTFTPRFSVTEKYTDNFFLENTDTEYEYITTVSPGFTTEILGKYSGARLSYDPSYVLYDRFDKYDGWLQDARFSGWGDFSKNTRMQINDTYIYTDDPLSEERTGPDLLTPGTDTSLPSTTPVSEDTSNRIYHRRGREPYYRNTANIGVVNRFREADSIDLEYVHNLLENDDPTVADHSSHVPSLQLNYWVMPNQLSLSTQLLYEDGEYGDTEDELGYEYNRKNSSVTVNYWFVPQEYNLETEIAYERGEYSDLQDDFDHWYGRLRLLDKFSNRADGFIQYAHTAMKFHGESEDYQIYDLSIGMHYSIREEAPFSLRVGYFVQDNEESGEESGIIVDGNIGKSWTYRRGSISLIGLSGYEESYFRNENLGFNIYYQVQSLAQYSFSRKIHGDISVSYRKDDYVNQDPEREETTSSGGFGFDFQPKRWVSIRLEYTYSEVDSTIDEDSYEENRALLKVTLSPSRPFRVI